jgi:hypothetical protein
LAVDLPIGAYVCLAAPYAHGSGGATVWWDVAALLLHWCPYLLN